MLLLPKHQAGLPQFIEALAELFNTQPLLKIYTQGNPCSFHRLCVELARADRVAAVITTNFDTLFECALADANINHDVFCTEVDFGTWQRANDRASELKFMAALTT